MTLAGGETASLPELVRGIDISGTALGWVEKGKEIDGRRIKRGDKVIGLGSSGVHSNGYSLVRRMLKDCEIGLREKIEFDVGEVERGDGTVCRFEERIDRRRLTVGEVLLNPTCIYVDPVYDLLKICNDSCNDKSGSSDSSAKSAPCAYEDIHGIAHITGGGLSNLLRLKQGMGYTINNPLPVLPEFKWLQQKGGISDFEMYRTFNMGMGMAIVVEEGVAEDVVRWLRERFGVVDIVGEVDESGSVRHTDTGVVFEKY